MEYKSTDLTSKYLRSRKIPSTACSGCGLGINHKLVVQAIKELGLEVADIVWGTSIGCAGRQTFATWKGDAFGIGLAHLIHAARCNADMTVIVNDNLGYQSTGGQYGWTTPQGSHTDSSPYGLFEPNLMGKDMDVLKILEGAGATFLARHVPMDGPWAVETIKKAILNNGFSLVHMPYPCPTNFASRELGSRNQVNIFRWIKEHAAPLGQEKENTFWATGIWHDASNSRPEFSQYVHETIEKIRRTGSI